MRKIILLFLGITAIGLCIVCFVSTEFRDSSLSSRSDETLLEQTASPVPADASEEPQQLPSSPRQEAKSEQKQLSDEIQGDTAPRKAPQPSTEVSQPTDRINATVETQDSQVQDPIENSPIVSPDVFAPDGTNKEIPEQNSSSTMSPTSSQIDADAAEWDENN